MDTLAISPSFGYRRYGCCKETEKGGAKATARGGLPSLGKGGGSPPGSQPSSCLLFWAEIQDWGERPGLLASAGGEAPSQDQEQRKPEQCCSWRDWWKGSCVGAGEVS